MKAKEIRELNPQEIRRRLEEARETFFKYRFQFATGQLKNTSALRLARREIARLETILREQERAQS